MQNDFFGRMLALRLGLMQQIIPVEREHGLWYPDSFPVDLGTRQGQMLAKEMAYRYCEELMGEVLDSQDLKDRQGELTDAFLFFLSFCVVVGVTPSENYWPSGPVPGATSVELAALSASSLMAATNMLKARPWRRAFDAPDPTKFEPLVQFTGYYLWKLFKHSDVTTLERLEELYLEKHNNALQRLATGY